MRAPSRGGPLRAWLPPLAWALFLLWLGGRPGVTGPALPGLDKAAHLALYAVLGWLLARARAGGAGRVPGIAVLLFGCAVGAADELHQSRVPARTADPFDFVADAAGVLLGFAAGRRGPGRGGNPDSE